LDKLVNDYQNKELVIIMDNYGAHKSSLIKKIMDYYP